jgi:Tol biopolymer transport system component
MNKRATLALLLTVGVVTPAWAQDVECETSNVLAVYSNRHDTAGSQFLTWDIYLMDPDKPDPVTGIIPVWRHLPSIDDDGQPVQAADWAPALSPDGKGRIVFDSNRNRGDGDPLNTSDLFLMNHTPGGKQTLVTRGSSASWSPNAKRIAFHASAKGTGLPINGNPGAPTSDSAIFIGKVRDLRYGAAPTQITHPIEDDPGTVVDEGQVDDDVDWSPVGKKIAFIRKNRANPDQSNPTSAEIYVVNVDGTGLTRLTTNSEEERGPAWSPDGKRIVYSCRQGIRGGNTLEICVMKVADRSVKKLTDNDVADLSPHWSPDGKKIAFQRPVANPVPGQGQQIWVMNADLNEDGTVPDWDQLTSPPGGHLFPAWGEIKAKCDDEDDEDDDDDNDDN